MPRMGIIVSSSFTSELPLAPVIPLSSGPEQSQGRYIISLATTTLLEPMPKNSCRKEAALRREHDKRGEIDPKEGRRRIRNFGACRCCTSSYQVIRNANSDLMPNVETNATSRKQHTENNDLIDTLPGQSTSTLYRERNGSVDASATWMRTTLHNLNRGHLKEYLHILKLYRSHEVMTGTARNPERNWSSNAEFCWNWLQ
ncbi:hypothetical protein B0H14DRAFT_2634612, partial [Mycena olivaceomarginata]